MFVKRLWQQCRGPSKDRVATYLDHVSAGETFNRAVSYANLESYFNKAIARFDLEPIDDAVALTRELEYVVPGQPPKGKSERVVYDAVMQNIKNSNAEPVE